MMWYPNSRATNHITLDIASFCSTTSLGVNFSISTNDRTPIPIIKSSNVLLSSNHKNFSLQLYWLFHPPPRISFLYTNSIKIITCLCNLMNKKSWSNIEKQVKSCQKDMRKLGGVYCLSIGIKNNMEVQQSEGKSARLWLLHLGHLHDQAIVELINNKCIDASNKKIDLCSSCLVSKAHALPHKTRNTIYKHPLELIFADTWEPSPIISLEGYRLNFIDASSNFNWTYLMQSKLEIPQIFKRF